MIKHSAKTLFSLPREDLEEVYTLLVQGVDPELDIGAEVGMLKKDFLVSQILELQRKEDEAH